VIELHIHGPMSAAETAEKIGDGMTEPNVHQVASRFQRRFVQLLAQGDNPG
jgi:hypothetical protein